MALEYKVLGQDLVSYTTEEGTVDTTSYYVSYEEQASSVFIAVCFESAKAAYSEDGVIWTQTDMPDGQWRAVTYGYDRFVAVSNTNQASYSTDGVTWTETTLPVSTTWWSVAYGDGKFVAVGSGSTAAYSTDGITWTAASLAGSTWYSVTYGGDKFVAVNSDSQAAYSTDGITWMTTALPVTTTARSVTYGDGKFVTVGTSGTVAYSTDGIAWTQASFSSSLNLSSVAYGDGRFVVVAFESDISFYSTDGVNWTQTSLPGWDWSQVTYGGDKFVVVASGTSRYAYSLDGITWEQGFMPPTINGDLWQSITYGQTTKLVETLNIIGGQGTAQTEEFLPVTFYTVPAGKQTAVTSVFVANHNDTATTYDFAVVPAGEELSLKHHIRWDMEIAANDFENISTKITMSAGDSLVIFPSTVDTVSVTAFGVEK